MSLLATLSFDNTNYKVLKCQFGISQAIDREKMILKDPTLSLIKLELDTVAGSELLEWKANINMRKTGNLTFYQQENDIVRLKRFNFIDAWCVSYDEVFDPEAGDFLRTNISISTRNLVLDEGLTISNN